MKTPIVIAAFGTTTGAMETYSFIDKICSERFGGHDILWAYSSRMVKDRIKMRQGIDLKHPHQVLEDLKERGYQWAVVQSLHLICGYEFYRLIEEVRHGLVRTSIGLPLLSSPEDYDAVAQGLGSAFPDYADEAVVLVGHGTDHPAWSSYLALHHLFCERFGSRIFMGVVEGYPSKEKVVKTVIQAGFKKVRLIPFLLVAGRHFQEDLAGNSDSWKTAFEEKRISVSVETKSLGFYTEIIEIFCQHINDALDVI
jgi:sirohydrochlorin cobaltochelatase